MGVDVGIGVVGVDVSAGVVGVVVGVGVGSAQAASSRQPTKTVARANNKNFFNSFLLFLFGQWFLFITLPESLFTYIRPPYSWIVQHIRLYLSSVVFYVKHAAIS